MQALATKCCFGMSNGKLFADANMHQGADHLSEGGGDNALLWVS